MIIAAAQERGTPIPKSILDAPYPEDSYQERLLDAFWKLSTCRQIGMNCLGPIPWDAIDRFARKNEFASDEIEYDSFVSVIQALDNAFLEHQQGEIDRESKKHGKAGSFRPPNTAHRGKRPRKR